LVRKLRKYIRAYAQSAKLFRWIYTDIKHRIRTNTFSESKRMMFEEENLFGFVFFALYQYQGKTSVVSP
jgi:hypothetical protein